MKHKQRKAPVPESLAAKGTRALESRSIVDRLPHRYTARPSLATLRLLLNERAAERPRLAGKLHLRIGVQP